MYFLYIFWLSLTSSLAIQFDITIFCFLTPLGLLVMMIVLCDDVK